MKNEVGPGVIVGVVVVLVIVLGLIGFKVLGGGGGGAPSPPKNATDAGQSYQNSINKR